MVKPVILLLAALTLVRCSNAPGSDAGRASLADSIPASAPYDAEPLFEAKYVISGADTIPYPNDLALNKQYAFAARQADTSYALEVTRTGNMVLTYAFKCSVGQNNIIEDAGEATLNDSFFLAPEGDTDPEDGGYSCEEYSADKKDHETRIRVGMGLDGQNRLRAKVTVNFTSPQAGVSLGLDHCPVLYAAKPL